MTKPISRRKIPDEYWEEIYDLYSDGTVVPEIRKIINKKSGIESGERAYYLLLDELRIRKQKELFKKMDKDTNSDLKRLKWWEDQLTDLAIECRQDDNALFLRCFDRAIKLYELKFSFRAQVSAPDDKSDNGRESLLAELVSKITDIATHNDSGETNGANGIASPPVSSTE